jgi:hypothetical protein
MRERLNSIFRIVCVVLAGVVLFQVSRLIARRNAFAQISIGSAGFTPTETQTGTNKPAATAPPEITARIEKIKETQVLGQIIRPPPMALIGIAGPDVLLRAPNGQTGMIREGEELGGAKLLQIGVNRVLVLHEGKTNELTLFGGFGSESLLGKEKSK